MAIIFLLVLLADAFSYNAGIGNGLFNFKD